MEYNMDLYTCPNGRLTKNVFKQTYFANFNPNLNPNFNSNTNPYPKALKRFSGKQNDVIFRASVQILYNIYQ